MIVIKWSFSFKVFVSVSLAVVVSLSVYQPVLSLYSLLSSSHPPAMLAFLLCGD